MAPHYKLHIVSDWMNSIETIVMHSLLLYNRNFEQKYSIVYCIKGFLEVQKDTNVNFPNDLSVYLYAQSMPYRTNIVF